MPAAACSGVLPIMRLNLSRALIFVSIVVTAFVGASAQRGTKALWTEIPPSQADNNLAEINSRPALIVCSK